MASNDNTQSKSARAIIRASEVEKYTQLIETPRHQIYSDEPESLGGLDKGPTPMELMSAALAACTSITLRMYCEHKDLDVEQIIVDVNRTKVAELDENGRESKKMIDQFDVAVDIKGNIDEATKNRMLKIATRCPVHQTLKSIPQFNTYLKSE